MTRMTRRSFGSLLGASAAGLSIGPLANMMAARKARAEGEIELPDPAIDTLVAQYPSNMSELPVSRQNIAFMSLPGAYSYSVVSYQGQIMKDGNPVPGAADGMAAFGVQGVTVLVRNHELTTSGVGVVAPNHMYDPALRGGTTNVAVSHEGKLLAQWASLGGTERNCAGGPTPWGTWLTCEETFANRNGIRHGYVFEVDPKGYGNPNPLVGLGRYSHEAAAIDPATGIAYLTEDRGDSLLYRFIPAAYGDLHSPGKLEALRLLDFPSSVNTATGFLASLNVPLAADWVPIDAYDPDTDTTRAEGRSKGAARFSRGEGCWYGDGLIYFVSTDGGNARAGQVWAFDPAASTLALVVESTDRALLDAPDNITVGPDGRLYLCEDGSGGDNIVVVEHDGSTWILAQNISSGSEWAGACFPPAGNVMFVNMQGDGLTFAIKGPWKG